MAIKPIFRQVLLLLQAVLYDKYICIRIPLLAAYGTSKNKLNRSVIAHPTPHPVMLWTLKPCRIGAEAFPLHFSTHWSKTAERCTEGSCEKLLLWKQSALIGDNDWWIRIKSLSFCLNQKRICISLLLPESACKQVAASSNMKLSVSALKQRAA